VDGAAGCLGCCSGAPASVAAAVHGCSLLQNFVWLLGTVHRCIYIYPIGSLIYEIEIYVLFGPWSSSPPPPFKVVVAAVARHRYWMEAKHSPIAALHKVCQIVNGSRYWLFTLCPSQLWAVDLANPPQGSRAAMSAVPFSVPCLEGVSRVKRAGGPRSYILHFTRVSRWQPRHVFLTPHVLGRMRAASTLYSVHRALLYICRAFGPVSRARRRGRLVD
jgi:hypothetical protein